ncbi:MAG: hypothetical protein F6J92_35110, partial [Symploca sp. SIO1A3]|nr:hypothetical protein [Symploca sp. SIO1A3]
MDVQFIIEFVDRLVYEQTGKHLSDVQVEVIYGSWRGQTYVNMSQEPERPESRFAPQYFKDTGYQLFSILTQALRENVKKTNFRSVMERHCPEELLAPFVNQHIDWGGAPTQEFFVGREEKINTLMNWIGEARCRLVAIMGMGGIGKTDLSIVLVRRIRDEFKYIIWRSLLSAPPVTDILADLIKFLSNQQETHLPDTLDSQIDRLLHYLKEQRCLVVLDNAETILQGGSYE